MPELPDVEIFRRYLARTALHQTVTRTRVENPKVLEGTSPAGLGRKLKSRRFTGTRRHGKHLFVEIDGEEWLRLHFGMTGFLKYHKDPDVGSPHPRVQFFFTNGYRLEFDNQRLLGTVEVVDDIKPTLTRLKLGPDALAISADDFIQAYQNRRGGIKSGLMNQRVMAGIGNIYADEVLFQAGIHPLTPVRGLPGEKLKDLHRVLGKVLKTAIDRRADPGRFPDSFLIPRRKEGESCPGCGGKVRKIRVQNRGTYLCPACQPKPSKT